MELTLSAMCYLAGEVGGEGGSLMVFFFLAEIEVILCGPFTPCWKVL